MKFLAADPERVHLVNQTTGEDKVVLINPEAFSLALEVRYTRIQPPGLSHEVLQYQGTGNRKISNIAFMLDRFIAEAQPDAPDIQDFERFVMALTVPPGGTSGARDTRPPRAMVIWPGVLTMECVLTGVEFTYTDFSVDGGLLAYTASCSFEEILDERRTSEQYRRGL